MSTYEWSQGPPPRVEVRKMERIKDWETETTVTVEGLTGETLADALSDGFDAAKSEPATDTEGGGMSERAVDGHSDYCMGCNWHMSECICDEWDDDEWAPCECGGSGWVVTCIDDLCRGAGWCMHGDGEKPCAGCNSDGDEPNPDARWA